MGSKPPHKHLEFQDTRTYPLSARKSKVGKEVLADPGAYRPGGGVEAIIPPVLKGADLRAVADGVVSAVSSGRAVILSMGAHPIKVGLSRLIIDLIDRGILTAVAGTGAIAVHEIEMALAGQTSEEVGEGLPQGDFGMAEETGAVYHRAVRRAENSGYGLGQALGQEIQEGDFPRKDLSILAAAYKKGVPATLHVALGSDIVHMHPGVDAGALGCATYRDFQVLAQEVIGLDRGGVFINLGSAVLMPEIFLKALNVARNLTGKPHDFIAVDFDMIRHYRPTQNVVTRPVEPQGKGYQITGHHEILLPLLYAMIRDRREAGQKGGGD